jgi:putative membrane protein
MKLLFSKLVLVSGAAMAAAATLPVMVGGIAAMRCLLGRDGAGARRALNERYARGEINREEYMQRRKDLGEEGFSA